LKGKHNFGYKFIVVIALLVAIGHVTARGHHDYFDYDPAPQPDSPAAKSAADTNNTSNNNKPAIDTTHNLRFPIHDKTGDPQVDQNPASIDLRDPPNLHKTVDYDPVEQKYYFNDKLGEGFYRNPTYMTMDEYLKYQADQDENAYWQRRLDALSLFNKKPELPQMYKEGLFDRIFGNNSITVKPQGNVDVTFGGNWQNIKNPTLVQRAQKYGIFDFDMQMNINLLATVGDKLKLNISNNTKATFDYQNMQKLEYTGKEDEIIKKIEAGNISFPLKSNLISGVQSLFGIKTTLQFGKLWVTGVLSQQKSQRKSLTIQGGAQTQTFAIKADNYEENRDFLLAQYFHDNYNAALKNFPVINSLVTINRVEIWVTNSTGAVTGVRNIYAFMDLGEKNPYNKNFTGANGPTLPDNSSNRLYSVLLQNPGARVQQTATRIINGYGLQSQDYVNVTARKLAPTEFSFNAQLGYVLLNTQLNPSDVLGVAYRYTYKGKTYQVGEFAEDLPPDTTNSKALFLKMLKNTNPSPTLPTWQLMMKNVYALGGLGVSKDQFQLNVLYQDPGGIETRYISEGPNAGVPLLTLLNLDRLNAQNEPQPDGVFDFVDGITINTQQGKVIFPVLEPFGRDLAPSLGTDPNLQRKYVYNVLYDSTRTVALQDQQNDRYIMRGSYKSTSSSEIFLGGFNIPPGSVTVTAGGTKLVENQDYSIDYGLGRLKILNTGILNSGTPINVQYEDNSTFGFTQQNFMGARFDYYVNKKLTIGATAMRLTERPFTQKVNFGDDPIKNTVLGMDANYQSEVPALTRALDKLPIYSTTAPSFVNASGEVASLLPGHPKQINALDPEGSVYIDDFEGTTSTYDMKLPAVAWSLASTPNGAVSKAGQILFPESANDDQLSYGYNRAKLAWYFIEPTLVDGTNGVPSYVSKDPNQHYIRLVQQTDVFPTASYNTLQTSLSTLDLGYYPNQRGPYNFDNNTSKLNSDGTFRDPINRWGGIMRPIDNTDFEASNVEFIQFWMLDPFIGNPGGSGGSLYFNLGDVSEDVLKDSRLFFENGIPYPFDRTQLDTTVWGYVPKFEQQVTRAFSNDPASRAVQDVGYDGLDDAGEAVTYSKFLTSINTSGISTTAKQLLLTDPASDNYHYYLGDDYDQENLGVLARYKNYNNPQGNSPITSASAAYSSAATTIPESEDINKDNTLNEAENYYQYRVDLSPGILKGKTNPYIVNSTTSTVKLPNGQYDNETWYQFKIPIQNYDHKIGSIGDFRSIRFIRMFMAGWTDSVIMRFATLELGRNQWRNYEYSLENPGEVVPQPNQPGTNFSVTSVSVEENSLRTPVPYVIPPGVSRQLSSVANGQNIQLNEQALSLRMCPLNDGDARAVYKEVDVDMRQFTYLRMFIHAESEIGQTQLKNGDIRGFIRIGSDFTNNYYEYQVPLAITAPGASTDVAVWPAANNVDLTLQDLVTAKETRDKKQISPLLPYQTTDSKGNTIIVVGNPNIGNAKNIMLGVLNPKKSTQNPNDDGLPKCTEVWFNELRMAGINDQAGYAAAGKVNLQLADLGNVNLSGSMHTAGYGNIDQKIEQRFQDNDYLYNATTNLALGKLLPRSWGVQLPLFMGYNQNISTPKYDPNNQDVLLNNELDAARNAAMKDSIRKVAQDFTSITSLNLTNVRVLGSPDKQSAFRMPWSIKNFDLSYSYNDQLKHNPTIAFDDLKTNKLGLGYTYAVKAKPIEPFKRLIKSKSKWFLLAKDFNFNPLPSSFSFRNDLNRVQEETQVRNTDNGPYVIPATFYKNFTWNRSYNLRWELTKSLSFDYTANNLSSIDEPYGLINTKAKEDSLWAKIKNLGRNTNYAQTFNSTYNVPLSKLPLTDWMSLRLGYSANYSWTAAAPIAYSLGNTIGNTQTETLTGEMNFTQLYNKSRLLRALNAKPGDKSKNLVAAGGPQISKNSASAAATNKSFKDLRNKINTTGGNTGDNTGAASGTLSNGSTSTGSTNASGGGSTAAGNAGTNAPAGNTGSGSSTGSSTGKNTPAGNPSAGGNNNTGGNNSNAGTGQGGNGKNNPIDTSKGNNNNTVNNNNGNSNGSNSNVNTVNGVVLSDAQLDSLVKVQQAEDDARARAERAKKKAAKKAARKLRRSKPPELNTTERVVGRLLTMLTRATINVSQVSGTVLPGWMDSTRFMGVNNYSMAPGLNFVYGYQPSSAWLAAQAAANRLSKDSLFNSQLQQTYSKNINATATLQPFPDMRIDLTLSSAYSKSHTELYADTPGGTSFQHLSPYETGSFNVSYVALNTMFKSSGVNSGVFNQFIANTITVSQRLGHSNPYTNGQPDPGNPAYQKGYTEFSQDVLITAFIAAYSGKSASSIPLINENASAIVNGSTYNSSDVKSNPFYYYVPLPNWRIAYNGLSKIPGLSSIFSTFVINHAYTGSMSMNGFNSNLLAGDLLGLGFPSFIDSTSHNYIPFYQVQNVTIAQAFTPLIGFDATMRNNISAKFEVRESKTESLSLIDYQVAENTSREYVVGMGYRIKGLKLPFNILGVRKLKNELIAKLDIGLRDDKNSNNYIANGIGVVSSGQKVLRISPTIDYTVTQKLTLHFFYNRQQTIPYVSNSYPITTTQAGVTLRFIFAP